MNPSASLSAGMVVRVSPAVKKLRCRLRCRCMVLGRELAFSPLVLVDARDEAGAPLAPIERELAARFSHPKRRSEWILGRLAAKAALARALAARGETVA